MATPESNLLKINANTQRIDELISKSREPQQLPTITALDNSAVVVVQNQNELVKGMPVLDFLYVLLAQIGMINVNSNKLQGGDYVFGKKAGINSGELIVGWQLKAGVTNPTSNDDFEKPYGFRQ